MAGNKFVLRPFCISHQKGLKRTNLDGWEELPLQHETDDAYRSSNKEGIRGYATTIQYRMVC